jgi:hypothetical protein
MTTYYSHSPIGASEMSDVRDREDFQRLWCSKHNLSLMCVALGALHGASVRKRPYKFQWLSFFISGNLLQRVLNDLHHTCGQYGLYFIIV